VARVGPSDEPVEGVDHHLSRNIGREGDAVALANTGDAIVGGHLDEQPKRTALARRRNRHIGLDALNTHGPNLLGHEGA